jgi:hypothetical protein
MTGPTVRLTDETLRRSLVELAGEPDANALLSEVLRTVDTVPQVRRRAWSSMRWERRVLLVAAVLATLGIGAAVSLSAPRPDPQPIPSPEGIVVPDFAVPFTYRLPEGVTEHLHSKGRVTPYPIFALSGDRLTLFLVTGTGNVHSCEDLDDESDGSVDSTSVGRDPVAFLEGLRDDVGVGIGPIQPAMLGNLPAVAAEIDPEKGTCSRARVHENSLGLGATAQEPLLRGPSTLIVAQAGAETIGVLIRGADEAAYREWLPLAYEYVQSFDFYPVDNP